MIKDWFNPFISFRARLLIFVTIIVLATIAALYYINRRLEERIAGLVAEHIKAISVSVDLAQSSFPKGEYIHDLLREDGRITVGIEEDHIIHKIMVVDANNRVIDSAESGDKGKSQEEALGDLKLSDPANPRPVNNADERDPELALTYPVETDLGKRKVVIVVSPHRLGEIVREESQERLMAIAGLSLLLKPHDRFHARQVLAGCRSRARRIRQALRFGQRRDRQAQSDGQRLFELRPPGAAQAARDQCARAD